MNTSKLVKNYSKLDLENPQNIQRNQFSDDTSNDQKFENYHRDSTEMIKQQDQQNKLDSNQDSFPSVLIYDMMKQNLTKKKIIQSQNPLVGYSSLQQHSGRQSQVGRISRNSPTSSYESNEIKNLRYQNDQLRNELKIITQRLGQYINRQQRSVFPQAGSVSIERNPEPNSFREGQFNSIVYFSFQNVLTLLFLVKLDKIENQQRELENALRLVNQYKQEVQRLSAMCEKTNIDHLLQTYENRIIQLDRERKRLEEENISKQKLIQNIQKSANNPSEQEEHWKIVNSLKQEIKLLKDKNNQSLKRERESEKSQRRIHEHFIVIEKKYRDMVQKYGETPDSPQGLNVERSPTALIPQVALRGRAALDQKSAQEQLKLDIENIEKGGEVELNETQVKELIKNINLMKKIQQSDDSCIINLNVRLKALEDQKDDISQKLLEKEQALVLAERRYLEFKRISEKYERQNRELAQKLQLLQINLKNNQNPIAGGNSSLPSDSKSPQESSYLSSTYDTSPPIFQVQTQMNTILIDEKETINISTKDFQRINQTDDQAQIRKFLTLSPTNEKDDIKPKIDNLKYNTINNDTSPNNNHNNGSNTIKIQIAPDLRSRNKRVSQKLIRLGLKNNSATPTAQSNTINIKFNNIQSARNAQDDSNQKNSLMSLRHQSPSQIRGINDSVIKNTKSINSNNSFFDESPNNQAFSKKIFGGRYTPQKIRSPNMYSRIESDIDLKSSQIKLVKKEVRIDEKGSLTPTCRRFSDQDIIGDSEWQRIIGVKIWSDFSQTIHGIQIFYKFQDNSIKSSNAHVIIDQRELLVSQFFVEDNDYIKNIMGAIGKTGQIELLVFVSHYGQTARFGKEEEGQVQFSLDINETEVPVLIYGALDIIKDERSEEIGSVLCYLGTEIVKDEIDQEIQQSKILQTSQNRR